MHADPTVPPPYRDARSAAAVVRAAIERSARELVEDGGDISLSNDPETVHRARVATRRLRSDLATFGPLLEPVWRRSLRAELKWLGALLGAVRDEDVLAARLEALADTTPDLDPVTRARLLSTLTATAPIDRDRLLAALRSDRFGALAERVMDAARAPRFAEGTDEPTKRILLRLARRSWSPLATAAHRLSDPPSDAELHEVRKRAKRARYALEAVAPIAPGSYRRLARRLATVQDRLGAHRDAVVLAERLRAVGNEGDDVEVAFLAGEFAAAARADALAQRRRWPRTWSRAREAARRAFD